MKILITGATGFLGGALARHIHRLGWQVTATGRNLTLGARLQTEGISFIPADLTNLTQVEQLVRGAEIICHCAAKSEPWGNPTAFEQANIHATQNLVTAALSQPLTRLVYVSTPSVYFYNRPLLNVREEQTWPTQWENEYVRTKRLAEQVVDGAVEQGLPVITVRPRALFGPGDSSLLPRLVQALAAGRLPIIGSGETLTDLTYIDNAVEALCLCLLAPAGFNGRKYNITNGEPVKLWDVLRQLSYKLGYKPPTKKIPYGVAMALATVLERYHHWFKPEVEPVLTRYAVGVLGQSRTLNIEAIQRDLGYRPGVSTAAGLEKVVAHLLTQISTSEAKKV